ncbi:hypothetical protein I3679_023005 [Proteus mirabilis]|uniref:Uncharacterized protein n=1 Tax=Proteus mirabilis TaxID=584 RepID=A0ABD5LW06_PROMI
MALSQIPELTAKAWDNSLMDVIGRQHLRQMWDDLAEVYDKNSANF